MKLSNIQLAIIALIVANIIWGASSPIFKWALQDIPPLTLAFLRFFLSALIILPFTLKHLKVSRTDIYILIFVAVIGLAFRITYYLYGLEFAESINAPIIGSAAPVFIIIGSIYLLKEKTPKKLIGGAVISFIGVLLIILQPILGKGFDISLIGNIFFIIAMALTVFYTLILKGLAPRYKTLTLLFWVCVIAAATLLPFAGLEIASTGALNFFTTKALTGIIFSVLFATVIAYILHMYGLKHVKASEVALFSYMDPFIAILIANPLLGERVTMYYAIGGLLVFLGIFIAEGRIHYHPLHLLRRKEEPESQSHT